MATVVYSNTNRSTMKMRVTYTAGNGTITITKLETCRSDGYSTTEYGASGGKVNISIGGTNYAQSITSAYYNANSSYTTLWSGSVSKSNLNGNTAIKITFTGFSNSNIANAVHSGNIDAGQSVATLTLTAGTSSSSPIELTTSGFNCRFSLTNVSDSTQVQYLKPNGTWTTIGTYTSNQTNISVTVSDNTIVPYYKNNAKPTISFRALRTSTGSTGATQICYTEMSSSIKPTLNSVTISADNTTTTTARPNPKPQLNNLFVKDLTLPIFTFNASGNNGSTITTYVIKSIGGTIINTQSTSNVTNPSAFNTINKYGNVQIVGYVIDSRGRTSSELTTTLNIINYDTPNIIDYSARRCLSDGTLNEDGTYALLSITYSISPISDNGSNYNTKTLSCSVDGGTPTSITIPNWSGTITSVVGAGAITTNSSHTIDFTLSDISNSLVRNITISPSFKLISKRAGGKGLTLGKVASEDDIHAYMDVYLHNRLKVNNIDVLTGELSNLPGTNVFFKIFDEHKPL
mgnify:CR=1 FL=1